jgi:hypothetical protein
MNTGSIAAGLAVSACPGSTLVAFNLSVYPGAEARLMAALNQLENGNPLIN